LFCINIAANRAAYTWLKPKLMARSFAEASARMPDSVTRERPFAPKAQE